MFLLRWRMALSIVLPFLVLPFASTAPTDGTPPSLFFANRFDTRRHSVPSAASFYVSSLPDLHQDPTHQLHIYAGHLNSDPNAARLPATTVTAHIYFVLVKARRSADRERIIFWFNVSVTLST